MESGSSLSGYGIRKTVAARLWKHDDTQHTQSTKVKDLRSDDDLAARSKRRNSIVPHRPTHQIGNLNAQGSSIALAGEIRDIYVTYHGVSQDDETHKEVKGWFGYPSPDKDRLDLLDAKGERTPDTCQWIQDIDAFQSWLDGDDASLLWICGGAGTGKTMISAYLTEPMVQLRPELSDALQIHHFCHDQNSDSTSAAAVLRNLLYQLVLARPALSKYIKPRMEGSDSTKSASTASRAILWSIFENVVKAPELGTFYCVLDGLDECDDDSRRYLGRQFNTLFSQESTLGRIDSASSRDSSSGQRGKMKLLIVTREIPGVRQQPQIKLDDHSELRNKDIESLVRVELGHLHMLPDFTEEFGKDIRRDILERAKGTFLWVGYALRECRNQPSCIDVQASLRSVPNGLHQVYRKALSNIPQQNRHTAKHILTWVALAQGDISFQILSQAADIEPDPSLGLDAAVAARVRDCDTFVKTRERLVTLVHASVRDFLVVDHEPESDKWEHFIVWGQQGHLNIARKCIEQIEASDLRRDKCLYRLDGNSMLAYAIQRWPEHARLAGEEAYKLLSEFESFFAKGSIIRNNWWKTYTLNYPLPFGVMPALQKACYFGIKPWAVKLLTDRRSIFTIGHRVNEHSWSGATPLSCAIAGGHQDIVDFLLDARRATVDGTSWFTRAGSLHFAAASGRTDFVKQLLDSEFKKGAWVNAKRAGDGTTALHLAAQAGHVETLLSLLEKGADPTVLNFSWETPLHLAAASGQGTKIIFPLVDPKRSKVTDIETRSRHGHTALTEAARRGWKDTVLALIKAGANVNGRDSHTRTPLQMAAVNGSLSTAKCLVENDADFNATNASGAKAIHYAAEYSKPELLKFFFDLGNSLEEEDHICQNLYHWAAARGNTDVIKMLHRLGLDVNKIDRDGDTPLHHAASGGNHVDAHRALLEAGVNVNAVNKTNGRTAYLAYLGVSHKTENEAYAKKVATIHFEYGADFTITDNKKKSALDYARKKGHNDLAAFLMKPTLPEPKEVKDMDSKFGTRDGDDANVAEAEAIPAAELIAEDITPEVDGEQKASEAASLGSEAEIEGQSPSLGGIPLSNCEEKRGIDLNQEQPTEDDVLTSVASEGQWQKSQAV